MKSVKSGAIYLTKTKFRLSLKLSLLRGSRPKSAKATCEQLAQGKKERTKKLYKQQRKYTTTKPRDIINSRVTVLSQFGKQGT